MPCAIIGYKDNDLKSNKVKKDIAIDILGNILFGKSSETFEKLYESGKIISVPSINYEFSKTYSHVLIQIQTDYIDYVVKEIEDRIEMVKKEGINEDDFERAKKSVYGDFVKEYNEVSNIATVLVSDYFKNINSLEYFEEFASVSKDYVEKVLKETFCKDKEVLSIITNE